MLVREADAGWRYLSVYTPLVCTESDTLYSAYQRIVPTMYCVSVTNSGKHVLVREADAGWRCASVAPRQTRRLRHHLN